MEPKKVIGLMSGTSLDGVDAVLANIEPDLSFEILDSCFIPYEEDFKQRIFDTLNDKNSIEEICRLNFDLAHLYARVANSIIERNGKPDLIASHGQTVFHIPGLSTLQLGSAPVISQVTGCSVVSNFREADIAVGGQGAPLVCYFDEKFFKKFKKNFAIQNIGGMSNVTFVGPEFETFGFDCGPGNVLIDYCARKFFDLDCDKNGDLASKGCVNSAWLDVLLSDEYYKISPPKTTGREYFSYNYAENALRSAPKDPYEVLATLCALNAKTIADSYRDFAPDIVLDEIVLGGGGAKNLQIIKYLRQYLPDTIEIKTHEDYGINSDFKEALAFAILGYTSWWGIKNNLPSCTGAKKRVVLGQLTL